jgi:hypothetical protein
VTSGEASDTKQLAALIGKAEEAGLEAAAVVGDATCPSAANPEMCEGRKGAEGEAAPIKLAARLSECAAHGQRKEEWDFNKDAGMCVCPEGRMAVRKARQGGKGGGGKKDKRVEAYYFDVEKCKRCPRREGCYRDGAKTKSYNVKIKQAVHSRQEELLETDEYKGLPARR